MAGWAKRREEGKRDMEGRLRWFLGLELFELLFF
jgi:hypothetical protein